MVPKKYQIAQMSTLESLDFNISGVKILNFQGGNPLTPHKHSLSYTYGNKAKLYGPELGNTCLSDYDLDMLYLG